MRLSLLAILGALLLVAAPGRGPGAEARCSGARRDGHPGAARRAHRRLRRPADSEDAGLHRRRRLAAEAAQQLDHRPGRRPLRRARRSHLDLPAAAHADQRRSGADRCHAQGQGRKAGRRRWAFRVPTARLATAACPRRRSWSSMRTASCCARGAVRPIRASAGWKTAASGRPASTASSSTTTASSISAATARNGNPNGSAWASTNGADGMILKFTKDGKFVMMIGGPGAKGPDSNNKDGGKNGTPHVLSARRHHGRSGRPTACMSPTATAIAAW